MASRAIDGDAIPGGRRALAMAVRRASGSRVSSLALRPGHELCPSRPRSLAPSREARSWSGAESSAQPWARRTGLFSIRAVVVKRFQANNSNFCRSRARASLRDQPLALPAWDQQEETEQSDSRTHSRTDRGRAIDTRVQSELVSSIVPRGTSLRWIVVLSLRQFGVRRSDCRRHFPCPAELGSITPHAMHNHGEPSG